MSYFDAEMELREHHCLVDQLPLMSGPDPDQIGDDPLNAWIPRGTTHEERDVSLLCSLLHIPFCPHTISPLFREGWRDGALKN